MQSIDEIAAQFANGRTLDDLRALMGVDRRVKAPEPDPEAAMRLNQYWQRVFADKPQRTEMMVCRSTVQEMDYEDARRKFWAILQFRAAEIEVIENRPFNWTFTDDDKQTIRDIVKYFINDKTGPLLLSKGLFICGLPGTGKTEIMTALSKFTDQYGLTKKFVMASMSQIYVLAKSDSGFDPVTPSVQFDRCFDEFGRYTGPVKRFGDELDINEAIIEERYNRNRRYGQLTHFITNTTPNEVQGIFSPMVYDRLRAMCTSIVFKGESKRF